MEEMPLYHMERVWSMSDLTGRRLPATNERMAAIRPRDSVARS